jgi:hypothetical protein
VTLHPSHVRWWPQQQANPVRRGWCLHSAVLPTVRAPAACQKALRPARIHSTPPPCRDLLASLFIEYKLQAHYCLLKTRTDRSLLDPIHSIAYTGDACYTRFCYPRFCFSIMRIINILSADTVRAAAQAPSVARNCIDLPHHFNSGDYKYRPLMVYHEQKIQGIFVCFPFYAFSLYATIYRNATPAYNESQVYFRRLKLIFFLHFHGNLKACKWLA